jgi:hypothetical protein
MSLTEKPVRFELEDPDDPFSPLVAGPAWVDAALADGAIKRVRGLPNIEDIKDNFLFGIPLISTLTRQKLPDAVIQEKINSAISEFETFTQILVQPVIKEIVFDFKHEDSLTWNPVTFPYKPVTAIYELSLQTGGSELVRYPNQWMEIQTPIAGLGRIVPLFGIYPSGLALTPASGNQATYVPYLVSQRNQWPNLWKVIYKAGFPDGCLPYNIYEAIGTLAAMHVLSMLGPVIFPINSTALGIDGLSQSASNPGNSFLQIRMNDLSQKYLSLMDSIKKQFAPSFTLDALG